MDKIKRYWLPDKDESEIKHRYKNCTCAKAEANIIKEWKNTSNVPLIKEEKEKLEKAVEWFGDKYRWSLINKCFFPNRSKQFIKA